VPKPHPEISLAGKNLAQTNRQDARRRRAVPEKTARHARLDVDDLIEKAHAEGLHINNLFEIGGRWRANIADKSRFFEFGEGRTPSEALRAALAKAQHPK
jgi:hypothetical protein